MKWMIWKKGLSTGMRNILQIYASNLFFRNRTFLINLLLIPKWQLFRTCWIFGGCQFKLARWGCLGYREQIICKVTQLLPFALQSSKNCRNVWSQRRLPTYSQIMNVRVFFFNSGNSHHFLIPLRVVYINITDFRS